MLRRGHYAGGHGVRETLWVIAEAGGVHSREGLAAAPVVPGQVAPVVWVPVVRGGGVAVDEIGGERVDVTQEPESEGARLAGSVAAGVRRAEPAGTST